MFKTKRVLHNLVSFQTVKKTMLEQPYFEKKVHRLALTNPHVCLTIRPGRSLNSVFEHLKHRWKKIHHQELHLVTKDGSTNVPKITGNKI